MTIDCILIASNPVSFEALERSARKMDPQDPYYRELAMSCVSYQGRLNSIGDIYNSLSSRERRQAGQFTDADIFSNTIAYLGTYLSRRGLAFETICSFGGERDKLKSLLLENEVVCVAVSTTYCMTAFPVMEIVRFIRRHSNTARIVVGGALILNQLYGFDGRSRRHPVLDSIGADYYILNPQGEEALAKLIETVKASGDTGKLPNVISREEEGYRMPEFANENVPLDENPVDWTLFSGYDKKVVSVRTSISCRNRCAFCNFPQKQGRYQAMTLDVMSREIESIRSARDIERLYFIDDTFNVPVKRFSGFLDMMLEKNTGLRWSCFLRCQYLDEELVRKMAKSGCETVFLGIESGSQRILDNMNKQVCVEDLKRGIHLLREHGILVFASFIRGFPGETQESCAQTDAFIEETAPDFFRVQTWYYSASTPIGRMSDEFGIKGDHYHWSHKTMDSDTASVLVDKSFHSVENSLWLPQSGADYPLLFLLLQFGLSPDEVKRFIGAFMGSVKAKLKRESAELPDAAIAEIRRILA